MIFGSFLQIYVKNIPDLSFFCFIINCASYWHKAGVSLYQQMINLQKEKDMNTDNTLAFISSMITSESSYSTLVEMINDMDLELIDVSL